MAKKKKDVRPVGLIRVLGKPPPEVEASVQKIRDWVQRGLGQKGG